MARVADLPASKLIRFLSAYGPDENNANMFDENVRQTSARNGIAPFELKAEFVERIVNLLLSEEPAGILIAGVAGDGKSWHLRRIWETLGGRLLGDAFDRTAWDHSGEVLLEVPLDSGAERRIRFVKDLSAYDGDFSALWQSVTAASAEDVLVVACNHGQILSRLRGLGGAGMASANEDAALLEDMFFRARKQESFGTLRVFDLSRTSQSDRLLEIVEKIATMKEWRACDEKACPHRTACPIRRNLDLLWNASAGSPSLTAERMAALVRFAAFDGTHLPVRELFLLVVNALLGMTGDPQEKRLTANCRTVAKIAAGESAARIDLFNNILGGNLSESAREKKSVYRRLAQFDVGGGGDPWFDNLIVLGSENPDPRLRSLHETLLGDFDKDPFIPGATESDAYFAPRSRKTAGKSRADETELLAERTDWLVRARRRVFFLFPEDRRGARSAKAPNVWALTAMREADRYLELRNDAKGMEGEHIQIDDTVLAGLNRVLTGCASESDSDYKIRVATNGASSRAPVGSLEVCAIDADARSRRCDAWIEMSGAVDAAPEIVFSPNEGEAGEIRFPLTPRRYEFLARAAAGTLPTSFSGQCQSEFFSLKARLIRAAERVAPNPRKLELRLMIGRPVKLQLESPESPEGAMK